ncbi:MAG: tripartite tricarboxylate transporter substrate binding protein, partial [Burkholderiaceae bacterium]|nr:tripartite tricarboxylate transporter substrate binding protein [Burkholderiaceae bacterium]
MLRTGLALLLALVPLALHAQDYPNRPLRLVVPFAPGGGADIVARAIAGPLGKRLGQTIIVDNKPGGGATLGANFVAKAPADGYTLLYTTPGPQMTNPYLMARLPYDPVNDLTPVSQLAILPSVLVVHKDVPARSLKELIDYARKNPAKINFASAGIGASSHLAGELFKQSAAVYMVHIPYRGTGPATADLLAGQVQMAIDSIVVYKPHIDAGSVRALGVSSLQRSPQLPDIPVIADVLKGFEGSPVNYLSVRAGTPQAIIDRLNREVNAVLESPELKDQLTKSGVIPKGSTPAEMAALIRS